MRTLRRTALTVVFLALAMPSGAQGLRNADAPAPRAADWRGKVQARQQQTVRRTQLTQVERQREALERARRQDGVRRVAPSRQPGDWVEVTERVSRTLRLGRNGTFELQNVAGNVVVTGGRGDQVRIEATKRSRHRTSSMASALLPQVRISVVERGGNIELRTGQPRRRDVWTAVDYLINLPSGANVVLGIGSGNVHVTNVNGELRADAADGDLSAIGVRRVRHLRTMRGNIEVADAETDELSANTVEGDLLLRNLKGRVLDLNSVNGDVRLVDVQMSRARLQTMAGDIEYSGPLTRSGRYEFATHSGNIRVHPSGGAGFDLEAHSFAGDIRSDYALKQVGSVPTRSRSEQTVRGTYGDAAAVLTARTFSGDILIAR